MNPSRSILPTAMAILLLFAVPAKATIPTIDYSSLSQLVTQTGQLATQLVYSYEQLTTLGQIFGVNSEQLGLTNSIMNTLGVTSDFFDSNSQALGQIQGLASGLNLGGSGDVGGLLGGGGGGGLLSGLSGLSEPLGKISQTIGQYGGQVLNIFDGASQLYGSVQGMLDGSTGVVDGIMSIANQLSGGAGTYDRLNKMSQEEMLRYGTGVTAATASLWNQSIMGGAQRQIEDIQSNVERTQQLASLANNPANTASSAAAIGNQIQLAQTDALNQQIAQQAQATVAQAANTQTANELKRQQAARQQAAQALQR